MVPCTVPIRLALGASVAGATLETGGSSGGVGPGASVQVVSDTTSRDGMTSVTTVGRTESQLRERGCRGVNIESPPGRGEAREHLFTGTAIAKFYVSEAAGPRNPVEGSPPRA